MKFRLQKTKEYFRVKLWHFNIYFADHTLSVRPGGLERSSMKAKRNKFKERLLESRKNCEVCGQPLDWKSASVHHIIPVSLWQEGRFDENNVQLLCHRCHYDIHKGNEQLQTLAEMARMQEPNATTL